MLASGMRDSGARKWIPIRKSNLRYYEDVELFYESPTGKIMLYKPAGMPFADRALEAKPYLGALYIRPDDKIRALRSAQRGFSTDLTARVMKGGIEDLAEIKHDLTAIVDETLSEPRSGHLTVLPDYVSSVVDGYASHPDLIKYLARISHTDYTTAIHSLNVMALTIGYCYFTKRSLEETRTLGLTALLHDVGKTETNPEILTAARKLTDEEYTEVKKHPLLGADILAEYGGVLSAAIPGTLHHHLRLDGTGYPEHLRGRPISEAGRIIAVIDSYEVMTNNDRVYRSPMKPYDALVSLKEDADAGLYDKKVFANFAYSLVDTAQGGSHGARHAEQVHQSDVAEITGTIG